MKIHLIAIGGSAMHNLAIALYYNHHTVSGSDDEIYNPARERLAEKGLLPEKLGWHPERIHPDLDVIILGMHARKDNPELLRALELGIPVFSYPEYIFQHAQNKKRMVIAGSHGKTTTTSMIMHALTFHGFDYDFLVGAQLEGFDNMVRLSDAPLMVIEGDEYLSSPIDRRPKFLHYQPHISIITGIAWDHINVFPTFENYLLQFENYLRSLPAGADLFYYAHDQNLQKLIANDKSSINAKSYEALPAVIKNEQTILKTTEGDFPMQIFGQHNLENLSAACLACEKVGLSKKQFFAAMTSFKGAAKRMQVLADQGNTIAFQDFAHAPSKVAATIKAVKKQFPQRRLIACLELHTFSSLNKHFLPQYQHSLNAAEEAFVYFTDHTLEIKKLPAISAEEIQTAFDHPNLVVVKANDLLLEHLRKIDWENSVLLLMSSGNFGGLNLKKEVEGLLEKKN